MFFDKLEEETLHPHNMNAKTLDFMCMHLDTIRNYISNHPSKISKVVEVIHTHGVKAGANKKATNPTTKQGKQLF